MCLNAPFGARCFLTSATETPEGIEIEGLNAPFGARCFLTGDQVDRHARCRVVLMHLLALGAF